MKEDPAFDRMVEILRQNRIPPAVVRDEAEAEVLRELDPTIPWGPGLEYYIFRTVRGDRFAPARQGTA